MSTFNYAEILAVGQGIIIEFGRIVTFVELGNTPTDSNKPWAGTSTLRSAPLSTFSTSVVFVEPSSLDQLGQEVITDDFVKRSQQILIVASTQEFRKFDEIIDTDGSRWKIQGISELKPGDSAVMHFIGVSR
jgi:hypothetical protein